MLNISFAYVAHAVEYIPFHKIFTGDANSREKSQATNKLNGKVKTQPSSAIFDAHSIAKMLFMLCRFNFTITKMWQDVP